MADKPKKSIATYDLLELPGLRHLRRRLFLRLIRGERGNMTRTLLFLDLAEATQFNTPLDQALELIAQGYERVRVFGSLSTLFFLTYPYNSMPIRSERMVKLLAWYLLPWVRQG